MICPTCKTGIHSDFTTLITNQVIGFRLNQPLYWYVSGMQCPECNSPIISYEVYQGDTARILQGLIPSDGALRTAACPEQVPASIAKTYREAYAVLNISPNASGILSRKCLQAILKHEGTDKYKLDKQVRDYIDSQDEEHQARLSLYLHSIREFGNIGAHPDKDAITGEDIELDIDEAQWMLNLLEEFMDHVFVQPAKAAVMRERLTKKLGPSSRHGQK